MSQYQIYRTKISSIKRKCRKLGVSFPRYLSSILSVSESENGIREHDPVYGMEHAWDKNGRNIIFIEDRETVPALLNMKIKGRDIRKIPLPLPVFSIAFPTDVGLSPVLVKYSDSKQELESEQNEFYEELGIKGVNFDQNDSSFSPELRLSMHTDLDDVRYQIALKSEVIQMVMDSDTLDTSLIKCDQSDEDGKRTVFVILKFIIALCVYNSATNNQFLIPGVPSTFNLKKVIKGNGESKKVTAFKFGLSDGYTKNKSEHIRSGHFRQLWDERFYKGEYSKLDLGSRWVYVKETLVGKATPYVQTKESTE